MDRDFMQPKHLQTSAMDTEDMSDRTPGAARRWIRAHTSLVTAIEQTFGHMELGVSAKQIYERRIQDSREHILYWREVLAETGTDRERS